MKQEPIHKVSDVVREFEEKFGRELPTMFEKVAGETRTYPVDAHKTFLKENLTTLLSSIVERIEGEKEVIQGKAEMPYNLAALAHNEAIDRAIAIIKSSEV